MGQAVRVVGKGAKGTGALGHDPHGPNRTELRYGQASYGVRLSHDVASIEGTISADPGPGSGVAESPPSQAGTVWEIGPDPVIGPHHTN